MTSEPVLLSGGNPQITKGFGDEKVADYIAAVPGWKQAVCRQLDGLISDAVPNLSKAVKWNTPFYGLDDRHWFVSFHCLTKYVKVAFPAGTELDPVPPGTSKQPRVRYLDIYEDAPFDAEQFISWVKQASAMPGEKY
ncbi:DUF1801 domain-containing protein [Devosia rhizoryzae]|uniref:DUF1801 domain-containing protein n=1 Tax=Devosia rhizoryzae TaxID=2774137 RepID=A0ABX7CBB4_9HYPH|nr:DUF1801 domain-containing protein [Devosia rhizoryzae]QQR39221.1 DUF1801 domain-containing protein [Devosia rhizoryzae]